MHSKNTLVHCAQLMILAKRKGLTFNDMKTRFHGGSSLTLPKHHSVLEQVCKAVEVPLKHMTPRNHCWVYENLVSLVFAVVQYPIPILPVVFYHSSSANAVEPESVLGEPLRI